MGIYKLKAPKNADQVPYRKVGLGVDDDGTLSVPGFAVAELIARGCVLLVGDAAKIDARAELIAATASEVALFLSSRGVDAGGLAAGRAAKYREAPVKPGQRAKNPTRIVAVPARAPIDPDALRTAALYLYDSEQD